METKTKIPANDVWQKILEGYDKKREQEALTMCAKRKLTDEEIDSAMVIGKWFLGWNESTGPCPIKITDECWFKKLCALWEWIAVLESDKVALDGDLSFAMLQVEGG